MLTEIEIEDVGTYRLPNMWQEARIKGMVRSRRHTAMLAYGMGMTVPQFKKLSHAQRDEIQRAFYSLTSPANIDPIPRSGPPPRTAAFRPHIHRTDEEKAEIGRQLLEIKKSLPRGHFGPWLKSEAGISHSTAQQCMRLAREAA